MDPHQINRSDPEFQIHIEVISWIRNRIEVIKWIQIRINLQMTSQMYGI